MQDEYIKSFYNEVCETLGDNYKIILEPGRNLKEDWIEYDSVEWLMEDSTEKLVNSLKDNNEYTFEEKILKIYEHICLEYVYDANVLYFFKKDFSDPENVKYIAVDWYGRIVGNDWIENRKPHNRRICYEFSRIYAKAINELKGNKNIEACMIGDFDNLHYVVGLTGEDYSAILDLDDFNTIKDLTRLKFGLTIEGIKIIRDNSGALAGAIKEYNKDKLKEFPAFEDAKNQYDLGSISIIQYFDNILKILDEHDIDSQGVCEYMKNKIENEEIDVKKVWKEVKAIPEKRYARCLYFVNDNKIYVMDSVDRTLKEADMNYIKQNYVFEQDEADYPYYGG